MEISLSLNIIILIPRSIHFSISKTILLFIFLKKDKISLKNVQEISKENSQLNELEIVKSNANSIKAVAMIRSYRQRGHLIAKLDPLGMMKSEYLDELHPESYGFEKNDYDKKIFLDGITNKQYSSIREILKFLKDKYCGPIGYEYMHISNPTERKWFRDRVEKTDDFKFTQNGKEAILNKLIQAEGFEKFLHTKYAVSYTHLTLPTKA